MIHKDAEKTKAIRLRKQGRSYNEILEEVPVAKSTLSLWLREVGLSQAQRQRLSSKKRAAQKRGGARKREMRLLETEKINYQCRQDIHSISDRELFLLGVALYWAEGTKKSGDRPGSMVDFANSDPEMVAIFVTWLLQFGDIETSDIVLRLHLHESHSNREKEIIAFWSDMITIPRSQFGLTQFKKHNPKTRRYKVGDDYVGLVSVRVKKSTALNRRILGWIYAIIATQK